MIAFVDVERTHVVLDAGTVADWAVASLFEDDPQRCDARWAASADACERLVRRHCTFPTSKKLLGEIVHATHLRSPRVPRSLVVETERLLQAPTKPSKLRTADVPRDLGVIQKKDRHVIELALASVATGVVTTDEDLAVGIGRHSVLRDQLAGWHVLDAVTGLPSEERRLAAPSTPDPRKPRRTRRKKRRR